MRSNLLLPAVSLLLAAMAAAAQQPTPTTAAQAPQRDTSYIDSQGTAHVTRVAPVPKTVSPEAQEFLARQQPDQVPPESLAQRRERTDVYTARARVEWTKICPTSSSRIRSPESRSASSRLTRCRKPIATKSC